MGLRGFKVDAKRVAKIKALRKSGWSFAEIGEKFGVSRQAVQQMLVRGSKRR